MMQGITKERIDEVVELVGLGNRIHEKVQTYSLGMRQRLGVAQALRTEASDPGRAYEWIGPAGHSGAARLFAQIDAGGRDDRIRLQSFAVRDGADV